MPTYTVVVWLLRPFDNIRSQELKLKSKLRSIVFLQEAKRVQTHMVRLEINRQRLIVLILEGEMHVSYSRALLAGPD